MFLALWEFEVKSGCEDGFLSLYGPEGDWARLFRLDSEFMETRLLRDAEDSSKYLTLDLWQSREAYESFKKRHRAAYEALDQRGESLT